MKYIDFLRPGILVKTQNQLTRCFYSERDVVQHGVQLRPDPRSRPRADLVIQERS